MKLVNGVVSLYEREQHYGGPEEGGWYYHTLRHVEVLEKVKFAKQVVEYDFTNAEEYDDELNEVCGHNEPLMDEAEKKYADRDLGLNKYGEGYIIFFEEEEAEYEDMSTQWYD